MPEAVRLVIWDLDDTFWRGTLSEGGIVYQQHAHDTVIALAKRGIVSTICSKNDEAPVRKLLEEHGIWDYFVMPSINWEPKGHRIAALIEAFQLRAPTILFIDDNAMNLQEALHYVPDLQTAPETEVAGLLDDPRCRGKDDSGLTRLAQYRLLAQRQAAQAATGDNVAFLRQSGVRVEIEFDVLRHADRAIELINRTNQLNFTKRRLPENMDEARAAFTALVREFDTQCGLIRVTDRYGDYGFCGFYLIQRSSLQGWKLAHFCFSCRILNMGVEAWLYRHLGRPTLRIQGDVASDVKTDRDIDWISFGPPDARAAGARTDVGAVFIHGGCDLAPVSHYFGMVSKKVTGRFNTVRRGVDTPFQHSQFLAYAARGLTEAEAAACRLLGYEAGDFWPSLVEDAAAADLWLLSFWADALFNLYEHRGSGLRLPFNVPASVRGAGYADLTSVDPKALGDRVTGTWIEEALINLQREFTCLGPAPQTLVQDTMRLLLARARPDALVFILGANEQATLPEHRFYPKLLARRAVNRWAAEVCQEFANVHMINICDFVHDESEVQQVNHFDRMVYYRLYEFVLNAWRERRTPAAVTDRSAAA
jgi:FkbH-like protein